MPVHCIFTNLLELITAKDANIGFQNPYLLEVGWSLFFQSLLATVIDSDVTVVRILERYFSMKYFMIFYH